MNLDSCKCEELPGGFCSSSRRVGAPPPPPAPLVWCKGGEILKPESSSEHSAEGALPWHCVVLLVSGVNCSVQPCLLENLRSRKMEGSCLTWEKYPSHDQGKPSSITSLLFSDEILFILVSLVCFFLPPCNVTREIIHCLRGESCSVYS